MKKNFLFFLALLHGLISFGQQHRCAFDDTPRSDIAKIHFARQADPAYRGLTVFPNRSIALFMHIIVVDNTPTSTPGQLQVMVD